MIVVGITMENWACFRGRHERDFRLGVHAVAARHEEDPDRSNWLGKSKFTRAILFALTGDHGERLEDDWITEGEANGMVTAEFAADGERWFVSRYRTRGKPTKLVVTRASSSGPAAQGDEAQKLIDRLVGLSHEDLVTSSFVEQKAMSWFVAKTTKPAERMTTVASWLRLEKLRACEKRANDLLAVAERKLVGLEGTVAAQEARLAALAADASLDSITALEAGAAEKRARVTELEEKRDALAGQVRDRADLVEYEQVAAAGLALKGRLERWDADRLKKSAERSAGNLNEKADALRGLQKDEFAKRQLAEGKFDGKCPVAGIECPAAGEIRSMKEEHEAAHSELVQLCVKAAAEKDEAKASASKAAEQLAEFEQGQSRLEGLRERAQRARPGAKRSQAGGPPLDADEVSLSLAMARETLASVLARFEAEKRRAKEFDRTYEVIQALKQERAVAADAVKLFAAAVRLFGKGGAQRRVAEEALAKIEGTANSLLASTGIELSVRVTWGREGSDLASNCDQCGAGYPASQRVKACSRCSAPRPKQVTERLDIELSDESGAADDLAGGLLQFAAGAWLRHDRGSAWSVAVLDEPFGSLDAANRKLLAGHLPRLLSECGFEQAFVIAHHGGIMEAMPGRVSIVAGPEGSRFE